MLQPLIPYATALALSAILGLLLVAFRWRYLRYVRRTIYAPLAAGPPDEQPATTYGGMPLVVDWIDAAVEAARPDPPALAAARRETRATRASFAIAGAVYACAAALVVWYGATLGPFGRNAAVWLGFASTAVSVVVIAAFTADDWRIRSAAGAAWFTAGFTLLVAALRVKPLAALSVIVTSVSYISLPLLMVTPLTLRQMRPLVVGFVPMVGLYIACAVPLEFILQRFGLTFAGHYTPATVAGGLMTAAAGIGIAIWQIRRGPRRGFVLTLAGMLVVGVVGISRLPDTAWNLVLATIGGIGFNGLLTVATWSLFVQFLKVKARGRVTDEILHYTFCWLVLTTLLPLMAQLEWQGAAPAVLALASYCVALFLLLRRQQVRRGHPPAARLLLLRVFDQEPVRNRLLDTLDDSWRRVGTVDLIVGADLAVRSLSARALQDFLLGRGRGRVLATLQDADQRIAVLPKRQAFDGRFPLNELHCAPGVWPHAVSALAAGADVVLMDFRGWRPSHRGATLELSIALERVLLSRLVVLADTATDAKLLATVAGDAWAHVPTTSINAHASPPTLTIIRCARRRRADARAIARAVFAAAGSIRPAVAGNAGRSGEGEGTWDIGHVPSRSRVGASAD